MSWDGTERRKDSDKIIDFINAHQASQIAWQNRHEKDDKDRFDALNEKIDVIYKNIVGSNGELGLKTRVVLLETSDKERKESHGKMWTAMLTTIFGLVGKIFWDIFKR